MSVATDKTFDNIRLLLFEFAMFLLFTTVVIATGLVTIDLLTEVRA
ncbi:MAG: hypothetical protein H8E66_06995 [Planctomycetes bacterium]|nr:hypothetical protein [Planctomycetota bacterium]